MGWSWNALGETDTAYLKEMKVEFWAYIENISGLIHEHSESANATVHFTYSIGFKHSDIFNNVLNEKDLPGKHVINDDLWPTQWKKAP